MDSKIILVSKKTTLENKNDRILFRKMVAIILVTSRGTNGAVFFILSSKLWHKFDDFSFLGLKLDRLHVHRLVDVLLVEVLGGPEGQVALGVVSAHVLLGRDVDALHGHVTKVDQDHDAWVPLLHPGVADDVAFLPHLRLAKQDGLTVSKLGQGLEDLKVAAATLACRLSLDVDLVLVGVDRKPGFDGGGGVGETGLGAARPLHGGAVSFTIRPFAGSVDHANLVAVIGDGSALHQHHQHVEPVDQFGGQPGSQAAVVVVAGVEVGPGLGQGQGAGLDQVGGVVVGLGHVGQGPRVSVDLFKQVLGEIGSSASSNAHLHQTEVDRHLGNRSDLILNIAVVFFQVLD